MSFLSSSKVCKKLFLKKLFSILKKKKKYLSLSSESISEMMVVSMDVDISIDGIEMMGVYSSLIVINMIVGNMIVSLYSMMVSY